MDIVQQQLRRLLSGWSAFVFVCTFSASAGAAQFTVNTFEDTVDASIAAGASDGVCADANGKCSLRAAVMEANAAGGESLITLPSGTFTLSVPNGAPDANGYVVEDLALTGDIDVLARVEIKGRGAEGSDMTVIEVGNAERIFHIPGGNLPQSVSLTLRALALRGSEAQLANQVNPVSAPAGADPLASNDGGCVRVSQGNLTIESVAFIECYSKNVAGGLMIDSPNTQTVIEESQFMGNRASGVCGAVFDAGNTIIKKSSFADNSFAGKGVQGEGGGAYCTVGRLDVEDSIFRENIAGTSDAAIHASGGAISSYCDWRVSGATPTPREACLARNAGMSIKRTRFEKNEAKNVGGAIFNYSHTHVSDNSVFVRNKAGNNGGAIHSRVLLTVSDSSFEGNEVTTPKAAGGAISANNAPSNNIAVVTSDEMPTTITRSTFSENIAARTGGALYFYLARARIESSTFVQNQAKNTGVGTGDAVGAGGAIAMTGAQLTISGSRFEHNAGSLAGGALYANVAAGATSLLEVSRSTFVNNSSESVGGAIGAYLPMTISTSSFVNNSALSHGGALFAKASAPGVVVDSSIFSENISGAQGGAIFNADNMTLTVRNSTISTNQAAVGGGGIYNGSGGGLTLVGDTIVLNTAQNSSNTATYGGGVRSNTTKPVNMRNTLIAENTATGVAANVGPNCVGIYTSGGYNLVADATGCKMGTTLLQCTDTDKCGGTFGNPVQTFDVINVQLAALADNGGPTKTHALLAASPAVNAGGSCQDVLPKDQRGVVRPGQCDIGAFELVCGNGVLDAGEICDASVPGTIGCNAMCQPQVGYRCTNAQGGSIPCVLKACGDGFVDVDAQIAMNESCDDGNITSGDGCSATCTQEAGFACTGNPSICARLPFCGDGKVDIGESCDDGNVAGGDGCDASCQVMVGYRCQSNDIGLSLCVRKICGDGIIDVDPAAGIQEQCDDGAAVAGDGCSATCAIENGWVCVGAPSTCLRTPTPVEPPMETVVDGHTVDTPDSGAVGAATSGEDSGRDGDAAATGAAAGGSSGGGCSMTPSASSSGAAWMLFAISPILLLRRRAGTLRP